MVDPVTLMIAVAVIVVIAVLVLICARDFVGIVLSIAGMLIFIAAIGFVLSLLNPEGRAKAGKQVEDLVKSIDGLVQGADKQIKLTERLDSLLKLQQAAEAAATAAEPAAQNLDAKIDNRRKAEAAYRDVRRLAPNSPLLPELANAYLRADDAVTVARQQLDKALTELAAKHDELTKAIVTIQTDHKQAVDSSARIKNQLETANKGATAVGEKLTDYRKKSTAAGAGLREAAAGSLQSAVGQVTTDEGRKELERLIEEAAFKLAMTRLNQ